MTTELVNGGTRTISAEVDDDGHFTAVVAYLVKSDLGNGPLAVLNCPGLPQAGDPYSFFPNELLPLTGEFYLYAFCRPSARVSPHKGGKGGGDDGEPVRYWVVEKTFSTKPLNRCGDTRFENPLLEPQRVSGRYNRGTLEMSHDRFGAPLMNSAWERIRGKECEVEVLHPEVRVEQNVADLELELLARVNGTLNDAPLWGLPRRCVRCTVESWSQEIYGTCLVYYTRVLNFTASTRIDPSTGQRVSLWDRTVLDEATKALNGKWNTTNGQWQLVNINGVAPSPYNPFHFRRYKDMTGENTKVILNGAGVPINTKVMGELSDIAGPINFPCYVTTSATHGLVTGDTVALFGFGQDLGRGALTSALGLFIAQVDSSTTFWIQKIDPNDITQRTLVPVIANGTYEGGGFWMNLSNGPGKKKLELLDESNFLELGIPTDLNFTA